MRREAFDAVEGEPALAQSLVHLKTGDIHTHIDCGPERKLLLDSENTESPHDARPPSEPTATFTHLRRPQMQPRALGQEEEETIQRPSAATESPSDT